MKFLPTCLPYHDFYNSVYAQKFSDHSCSGYCCVYGPSNLHNAYQAAVLVKLPVIPKSFMLTQRAFRNTNQVNDDFLLLKHFNLNAQGYRE